MQVFPVSDFIVKIVSTPISRSFCVYCCLDGGTCSLLFGKGRPKVSTISDVDAILLAPKLPFR